MFRVLELREKELGGNATFTWLPGTCSGKVGTLTGVRRDSVWMPEPIYYLQVTSTRSKVRRYFLPGFKDEGG